ncbi:PepSY domain-containing protein [Planctobacterium marinum]|uniref:PepSY domain-containing protein n=1 Tax=Planctobacterium marinum TaxID=1631968 RepID=A0AA48KR68_9ALTE|nr:hypothetical protein MACH26_40570 [Planctobacterium marinum]
MLSTERTWSLPPPSLKVSQPLTIGFADVLQQYPDAKQLSIKTLLGEPHLQFLKTDIQGNAKWHVINAITGKPRPWLTEEEITTIARTRFNGNAEIKYTYLLTQNAPSELAARHLPVWQVEFDDWQSSTFYIHPHTGDIVTKRHNGWRLFDVFWRLHILDIDGENVTNSTLTIMTFLALLMAFTGLLLTIHFVRVRFAKRLRR